MQARPSLSTRQDFRLMSRDKLGAFQLARLNPLLTSLRDHPLYEKRLANVSLPMNSLDELASIPLLTKEDILNRHSGQASQLFHLPKTQYTRFHQTSGSRGMAMPVLDSTKDWEWWLDCWQYVLDTAKVTEDDVAMMAFSFGPFIGFWTANDALVRRGALVVPGGGMSTLSRLRMIEETGCTLLCCTPTYAMHLARVAQENGIDLSENRVTRIIVAGEPGGSIPTIRHSIESQWQATVVDHAGASELGAWGFASEDHAGLHVIESEFIAEFLLVDDEGNVTREAEDGESCELVLTNLGRWGGPAIRYRTMDIVQRQVNHEYECRFAYLPGGILGRADDMMVIRGVNVFPSSIESIVRELEPSAEFRMTATRRDSMDQLRIELEDSDQSPAENRIRNMQERLRDRLALRVDVISVPRDSLPRGEGKSKRWVDQR